MIRLIFAALLPIYSLAQLSIVVDKDSILIGDQFHLTISVTQGYPLPILNDTIVGIEILSRSEIDSFNNENGLETSQKYCLTAWEKGTYYIPSFNIENKASDSIAIVVSSVALPDSVNLSDIEIKDIKAPIESPLSFSELKPYLLALIIITVIVFLIKKYIKKQSNKGAVINAIKPVTPPYEIALNRLEALNTQKLWQNGKIKTYYSELSEIIRTYIENGLGTPAMEIPTGDIIDHLFQKGIETKSLEELLSRADLAKFAKAKPIAVENQNSFQIAIDFVHHTKSTQENNDLE